MAEWAACRTIQLAEYIWPNANRPDARAPLERDIDVRDKIFGKL
jgi:hypothetical protein